MALSIRAPKALPFGLYGDDKYKFPMSHRAEFHGWQLGGDWYLCGQPSRGRASSGQGAPVQRDCTALIVREHVPLFLLEDELIARQDCRQEA